jgi:hypothetical protein
MVVDEYVFEQQDGNGSVQKAGGGGAYRRVRGADHARQA